MSVLAGDAWTHATRGSFILVPGGVTHDFENRGDIERECSNCPYPARSSRTCRASRRGLPKIRPKIQASNPYGDAACVSLDLMPPARHRIRPEKNACLGSDRDDCSPV